MITVITQGRLLDSVGDAPLANSSIVIEEGVIKDIYTGTRSIPDGARVIDAGNRTVMPGLIDAHNHPALTDPHGARRGDTPPLYMALRQKADLERQLQGGFTTIRDGAWAHWSLKQAVEDGMIKGPRLLVACAPLTCSGGHFDISEYGETRFQKDIDRLYKWPRICDGVEDCIKATREQFRNGADHIKIAVTGGSGGSNTDEIWHVQFTEEEIKAVVAEAEARGSYVMAHCNCDPGLVRAIQCGIKTIEHGAFMSEDTAKLMKEKGTFYVPTLHTAWRLDKFGAQMRGNQPRADRITEPLGPGKGTMLEGAMQAVENAKKVGVVMGSGSDHIARSALPPLKPWSGREGMELKLKTECGLTPYEAIKSATIVNAGILRMADKIGSIEAGKWADIIVVDGQPDRNDIEMLADHENIKLVMKKGEIFKDLLQ